MIRVLVLIAALAVAAFAAAWVADRPGRVEVEWFGSTALLSAGEALGLIGVVFVALYVVIELGRMVWGAPRRMALRAEERRRTRALTALSDGLLAVAAGDVGTASRAAEDAERTAPGAPLSLLLAAQAAQMRGDRAAAETRFAAMTEIPDMALVGLRGLAMEAARAGDTAAERAHARAANRAAPSLPWAATAAFHAATAERDFAAALALNDEALRHKLIARPQWKRRKAVLLTALAKDAPTAEAARPHALSAHNLAKDLVPAAVLAARAVAPQSPRKASGILQAAYRASPHPDLFAAALAIGEAQGASSRLQRAEAMAALRPDHVESALGLAAAALAARDIDRARAVLAPFLAERPTRRICVAMAEIEAAAGTEGPVREWLARAVRAPLDPAWVADGHSAAEWDAVSPITGELDRYVWRVPDGASEPVGPSIDLTALTRVLPAPAQAGPAALPGPVSAGVAPPADDPGTSAEQPAPPRDPAPGPGPRPSVPRSATPAPYPS